MAVFGCAGCGAVLTAAVSEVALPIHLSDAHWEALHPPLLEAGTYAVDPEPHGSPWRSWEEVGAQEAAARGVFAPIESLSDGPSNTILLAPGDMRGTGLIPERTEGYCYGINGSGGPNLACLACGLPVGSRIDDCGQWQMVRLLPQAVVRLPCPPERPVLHWAQLPTGGALWHGLSGVNGLIWPRISGLSRPHSVLMGVRLPVWFGPGFRFWVAPVVRL